MIETVASAHLFADETLRIQKNRLMPSWVEDAGGQGEDFFKTASAQLGSNLLPRICITTGVHGDELEGQYVCYELIRRIEAEKEKLTGVVDVYPGVNPLGIDNVMRSLPDFDLDMNRTFPGDPKGNMYERIADALVKDLEGANLVVDIHASNIYLTEVPQIRINVLHKDWLVPLASHMNVDLLWVHDNSTVLSSTLAFTMNSLNTPTLVVEMGVGMRITKSVGDQLIEGLFETMRHLGIWKGNVGRVRRPVISDNPSDVDFLNAPTGGVFVKYLDAGTRVAEGDLIGKLVDPLRGTVRAEIRAKQSGWLFTVREYPMVQEGSLLGRILIGSGGVDPATPA